MSLPVNHPLNDVTLYAYSSSIGATPIVAYVRVPFRCKVLQVGVVQNGSVTGTSTVTTKIGSTAITGGAISVTGGSAGSNFSATPTAANRANEDDVISFTPAGATGTVTGACYAVVRKEA